MTKLLRIRDMILLGLGVIGEFSEDLRLVNDLVPKAMELRYGFVPPNFKRKSYLKSINELLKIGNISKGVDKNGHAVLELSSSGLNGIRRKFPIFSQNKWSGDYMIVIFDIPEENQRARQVFRSKLRELGFGMLQESVWISPYHFEEDLKEFVDAKGYGDYVFVMKATNLVGEKMGDLINRVWHLDSIAERYNKILRGEFEFTRAWSEYLSVLAIDPLLPLSLLPSDWPRKKVVEYLSSKITIKNTRPVNLNRRR